ncbi:MAG TPA: hypothetical protein DD638_10815 [Pasteurellaceae bacterium]|nr:hypothetical protein [Pasteurellaceae bacterium]
MNKEEITSAYHRLGIEDVTVYVLEGWDYNISPFTTITHDQGVYNLVKLDEEQFKRLLFSLPVSDYNDMKDLNRNIIITHQLDFCRFVGVYTYGQIPTKVHQFITDAGVDDVSKLSKLQQGRIATFYLTMKNNPLFAMVDKVVDFDGINYEDVMSKIYSTYRVLDIKVNVILSQRNQEVKHTMMHNNLTMEPKSFDDFDEFRANLKLSIAAKLEPMIDDIIDKEINRFKTQIEENILQQLKLN